MARSQLKQELKSKFTELGAINKKQEKRVRYLETTTIKLVIAYIFLQALIFVSVVFLQNPARASCRHWWIPFSLSSLDAFIFALAYKRFIGKWERTQSHYDESFMELEAIHHKIQVLSLQESIQDGEESSSQLYLENQQPQIADCDMVVFNQRTAFIYLVSLALLAYTALILTASQSILCPSEATS